MAVRKVEAWKDNAGGLHGTRREAMEADAKRALGLIGVGTHNRLSAETVSHIMGYNKEIWAILQELNGEPELDVADEDGGGHGGRR